MSVARIGIALGASAALGAWAGTRGTRGSGMAYVPTLDSEPCQPATPCETLLEDERESVLDLVAERLPEHPKPPKPPQRSGKKREQARRALRAAAEFWWCNATPEEKAPFLEQAGRRWWSRWNNAMTFGKWLGGIALKETSTTLPPTSVMHRAQLLLQLMCARSFGRPSSESSAAYVDAVIAYVRTPQPRPDSLEESNYNIRYSRSAGNFERAMIYGLSEAIDTTAWIAAGTAGRPSERTAERRLMEPIQHLVQSPCELVDPRGPARMLTRLDEAVEIARKVLRDL